jgi:hypothetical protein
MTMYIVQNIQMEQQIRNLNCGRYCMEALLKWLHGSRYGKVPVAGTEYYQPRQDPDNKSRMTRCILYGSARTQHANAVVLHIQDPRAYGFDPDDYANEYGLTSVQCPDTPARWEGLLRAHGPIIAGGCIGAVEVLKRFGGAHFILVIGIDDQSDEIVYLDPLGKVVSGGLAFFGARKRDANQQMRMKRTLFMNKVKGNVLVACKPR